MMSRCSDLSQNAEAARRQAATPLTVKRTVSLALTDRGRIEEPVLEEVNNYPAIKLVFLMFA
jgi:hypothetical protein